ncbi:hypothetical protein VCNHCC010F_003364B, partial [Vibrio cholerae O1 str. NHCC-010F]
SLSKFIVESKKPSWI